MMSEDCTVVVFKKKKKKKPPAFSYQSGRIWIMLFQTVYLGMCLLQQDVQDLTANNLFTRKNDSALE